METYLNTNPIKMLHCIQDLVLEEKRGVKVDPCVNNTQVV